MFPAAIGRIYIECLSSAHRETDVRGGEGRGVHDKLEDFLWLDTRGDLNENKIGAF